MGSDARLAHAVTNIAGSAVDSSLAKVCPTCGVHYPAEFKVCPRDATELVDADASEDRDELVGQTLSQTYTLLRVIGEGGMGRVYEARHTRIGSKRFAIKMLHPEFARQPEVLTRFQREAEVAASVQSPSSSTSTTSIARRTAAPSSSASSSMARSSRATSTTSARCPSAPRSASSARSARRSPPRTPRASSTAT